MLKENESRTEVIQDPWYSGSQGLHTRWVQVSMGYGIMIQLVRNPWDLNPGSIGVNLGVLGSLFLKNGLIRS
jgi:hypothetical protein